MEKGHVFFMFMSIICALIQFVFGLKSTCSHLFARQCGQLLITEPDCLRSWIYRIIETHSVCMLGK